MASYRSQAASPMLTLPVSTGSRSSCRMWHLRIWGRRWLIWAAHPRICRIPVWRQQCSKSFEKSGVRLPPIRHRSWMRSSPRRTSCFKATTRRMRPSRSVTASPPGRSCVAWLLESVFKALLANRYSVWSRCQLNPKPSWSGIGCDWRVVTVRRWCLPSIQNCRRSSSKHRD